MPGLFDTNIVILDLHVYESMKKSISVAEARIKELEEAVSIGRTWDTSPIVRITLKPFEKRVRNLLQVSEWNKTYDLPKDINDWYDADTRIIFERKEEETTDETT